MEAEIQGFNCGTADLAGTLVCEVRGAAGQVLCRQEKAGYRAKAGTSETGARFTFTLPGEGGPEAGTVEACLEGLEEKFRNTLRIWIYAERDFAPEGDILCRERLDEDTLRALEGGARVLLEPKSEEAAETLSFL